LRSGEEDITAYAADALLAFAAEAVPYLVETTRASYPHSARWAAVRALGIIGSRAHGAVPALLALLEEGDLGESAIDALGAIGPAADAAAPALLCRLAREEDAGKRWRVSEALARIG